MFHQETMLNFTSYFKYFELFIFALLMNLEKVEILYLLGLY